MALAGCFAHMILLNCRTLPCMFSRKLFRISLPCLLTGTLLIWGCGNGQNEQEEPKVAPSTREKQVNVPDFSADSAYDYVAKQVAFGPRTPGSKAQTACAAWLEHSLKEHCDTVYRQVTNVKGGDGKSLPCINLIGSINPSAPNRILLLSHWDSRPWADEDNANTGTPIDAADDGGSGTAVLLEIARQTKLQKLPSTWGIDILLTDVEDYGKSEWGEDSYCLGTQYWAHHPHVSGYRAQYGILLDMVGSRGAQFPMESGSMRMAGNVVQKVWRTAAQAGYSSWFPFAQGSEITDDHVPVNKIAGIPTIDIICLTPDPANPFPAHWHTHNDKMDVIDRETLKAVGQTLLTVIYRDAADAAL